MSFTFDDAFNHSLNELEKFARLEKQARDTGSAPPVLKLVMVHGQPQLKAILKSEMKLSDQLASRMGLGGFKLSRIVRYLRSDQFSQTLEKTAITPDERHAILTVARKLDAIVPSLEGITLTKSLTRHIRQLSDRTEQSVSQVLKQVQSAPCAKLTPTLETMETKLARWRENPPSLESALQEIGKGLINDAKAGKIVFDPQGNLIAPKNYWFQEAKEQCLKVAGQTDINEKFNQIINRAILEQELRKVKLWVNTSLDHLSQNFAEEYCQKNGLALPDREQIVHAQLAELKSLTDNQAAYTGTPREFQISIEISLVKGYWRAHGIPTVKMQAMQQAFFAHSDFRRQAFASVQALAEDLKKELQAKGIPPLAQELLMNKAQGQLLNDCDKRFNHAIKQFIKQGMPRIDWNSVVANFSVAFIQKLYSKYHKAEIAEMIAFYQKWQANVQLEMSQGFHDQGEVLGEGICSALAARWVSDGIHKRPYRSVKDQLDRIGSGQILSEDRFRQAKFQHSATLADIDSMIQTLGIKAIEWFQSAKECKGQKQVLQQLEKIVRQSNFTGPSNGCAKLSFSNHAISLRVQPNVTDPNSSVIEFIDPNYGRFSFPVINGDVETAKNRCLFCLSEHITTFYGNSQKYLDAQFFMNAKGDEPLKTRLNEIVKAVQKLPLTDIPGRQKLLLNACSVAKCALAEEIATGKVRCDKEGKVLLPSASHWYQQFLKQLPELTKHTSMQEQNQFARYYAQISLNDCCKAYFHDMGDRLLDQKLSGGSLVMLQQKKALKEGKDFAVKILKMEQELGIKRTVAHWYPDFVELLRALNSPAPSAHELLNEE